MKRTAAESGIEEKPRTGQSNVRNFNEGESASSVIEVQGTKYIDSGGGFLIEAPLQQISNGGTSGTSSVSGNGSRSTVQDLKFDEIIESAPSAPLISHKCDMCSNQFAVSYLWSNFNHSVCDKCYDRDGPHSLITRTDAKSEYLLKDCDLDKREPPLRYISRKNPHNVRGGEMKLYLHLQVYKRAMEVWGTEDELKHQHEERCVKRTLGKVKKYNKQMKQLRMEVRSSLYTKATKENHVHKFGEDTYNEEDDTYTHTCTICSFVETYEKM